MKEDLHMNGNQLNIIDVAWATGYVIGQIPSQVIITRIRPSVWIPSCELIWTMLTFCLASAKTSNNVITIRFFVGLVEGVFYPAAHFLIGSWYKPSELGKRACIFQSSSAVAAMCSSYLQSSVYKGLNGVSGKAGWQWLFVMDAVISLPICIAGFFFIPDLPENTRAFYLSSQDAELAKKRMDDIGRAPRKRWGWPMMKRLFSKWHIYALSALYLTFVISFPSTGVNTFALWLKANNWSVTMIVSFTLPTVDHGQ
jgi:ACS family pantothenate transporter-like MFS transporter